MKEAIRTGASGSRPRVLFLSHTLPYPPDGGADIRTYNVLRKLASGFEVTALCLYRRGSRPTHNAVSLAVDKLGELARVEAFPIPQEHSLSRLLWDHARSVSRGVAYTHYALHSAPLEVRLRALLSSEHFDVVHLDSMDLSGYVHLFDPSRVTCTHHNVESTLLARRAMHEPSALRRAYMLRQARLMEGMERDVSARIALNILVSEPDRAAFEEISPAARMLVVPNGVDTRLNEPRSVEQSGVVFVGGYGWFPNRDAMEYFGRDILPLMRPSPVATWVGKVPDDQRSHFDALGIRTTGYVDDVRPFVAGAACCVVPLRTGGGTRLKILEAWSMGKAVVSTSAGCEGLDARDGENILIRDDAAGFARAVMDVLSDAELRSALGIAARTMAVEKYDWDVVTAPMLECYSTIAERTEQSMVRSA